MTEFGLTASGVFGVFAHGGIGRGNGAFSEPFRFEREIGPGFVTGDWDRDGDPDIATPMYDTSKIQFKLNKAAK